MIKLIVFVKRNAAMSPAEFHEYWRTQHAHVQAHAFDAQYALGNPAFDGTAEIWFDSVQDKDAFSSDRDYLAIVAPDERVFADMDQTRFLLCSEEQVI